MLKLENEISVIVVKADNHGKTWDYMKAIEYTLNTIPGLTCTNALGYWIEDNRLYKDNSIIASCNFTGNDLKTVRSMVYLAYNVLHKANQQAVSIKLNGVLYILDRDDFTKATSDVASMLLDAIK